MSSTNRRALPHRSFPGHERLRKLGVAFEDPVLARELRSWMRGGRSRWLTGGYALTLCMAVLFLYDWLGRQYPSTDLRLVAGHIAQCLWTWGCVLQAFLLPFFVPAFTAGAVTREREREMLELLLLSHLSARQICEGKLRAGVGHGLLLLAVSVPPLSWSFVLGTVTPVQVFQCLVILASCILFSGTIGLFASCVAPRTITATAWSYLVVGVFWIGLPILIHGFGGYDFWSMTTDLEIAAMLAAFMVGTLPLAVLVGGITLHLGRRLKSAFQPDLPYPRRVDWLRHCGGAWCVTAFLLWMPGMQQVILSGRYLLLMHPGTTLLSTSPSVNSLALLNPQQITAGAARFPGAPATSALGLGWETIILAPIDALTDSTVRLLSATRAFAPWLVSELWWMSCLLYLGAAGWLFLASVLRVKRMRAE